jgi:hypothetical protein
MSIEKRGNEIFINTTEVGKDKDWDRGFRIDLIFEENEEGNISKIAEIEYNG